ncbi:polyprenyl synthetase family protein [Gammaproteobacteria bacterium]|nr:polyprenyl synthetase family protein [Gammaproteobacteria bacterium]
MSTSSKIEKLRALLNPELESLLTNSSSVGQSMVEAMRYSVLGGGKRIRPILAMATCSGAGADISKVMDSACAIEFIHAYSLIHDDLPAMDDDELRHGQASTHITFGEAQAILAGDALQSLAFEVISNSKALSPETKINIIRILSAAIGWKGMAGGQSMDMQNENSNLSVNQLKALHKAKTGALIQASVEIGALSTDKITTKSKEFISLSKFGALVGLAFQIVDDLLDARATTDELGKPSQSDKKNKKKTFIDAMGYDESAALANKLTQDAISSLRQTDLDTEILESIAIECVRRTN